jgi:hypothetical protein
VLGLKHNVVSDTECYPDYWLAKFKSLNTGKYVEYEKYPGKELEIDKLRTVLANFLVITFNGIHYDLPMMVLALSGATNEQLKFASDWIINNGKKCWEFYENFGLREPRWIDHIDLMEVAFGDGSLKLYGGRLHSKRLQDLPIDPDTRITPEMRPGLRSYCGNDLDTTEDLARHLKPQLELRMSMSDMYGTDLRSKSDAQIAEAVIRKEVSDMLGRKVEKTRVPAGTAFSYDPPAFLSFQTEQLQLRLVEVSSSKFIVDENGSAIEPPALAGMVVAIGAGRYRMGIGGLHSSEQNAAHVADDETVLMDADVTSFYPSIILQCGLYPAHLTEAFLRVYKSILDRRVTAKRNKDKVVDLVLKIVLNGSFGKFGNRYSTLYSPKLLLQVTITGQFALLMLIEALHEDGIECVSANTDGIVLKFHKSRLEDVRAHIAAWSERTKFAMEETFYKALFSRDVNNYLALKVGGGIKGKGDYAEVSISKNPSNAIVNTAVKAFLEHGTPIEKTIRECDDIRQFLTVQRVTGGAVKITKTNYDDKLTPGKMRDLLLTSGWHQVEPGPLSKARFAEFDFDLGMDVETAYRVHCGDDEFDYIGKVVRFYIGRGVKTALHYAKKNKKGNRNKVSMSDGAVPCMELPDTLPGDIDYNFYINEARRVLRDIGVAHG